LHHPARFPSAPCVWKRQGYCGFVRGSQHIAGTTYGSMTRTVRPENSPALFKTAVVPDALPSSPQNHVKSPEAQPIHRLPGYTGHVHLYREEFGASFGSTTTSLTMSQSGKFAL
jgi:hypothetical protein